MAALAALVLRLFAADSFGAENVAPTKAELEEMYNAAFRAFDSNKFGEALKQLDAIDARQSDLAKRGIASSNFFPAANPIWQKKLRS